MSDSEDNLEKMFADADRLLAWKYPKLYAQARNDPEAYADLLWICGRPAVLEVIAEHLGREAALRWADKGDKDGAV